MQGSKESGWFLEGRISSGMDGPLQGWSRLPLRYTSASRLCWFVTIGMDRHPSAEEVGRYYEGFSNGMLWPFFHYVLDGCPLSPARGRHTGRSIKRSLTLPPNVPCASGKSGNASDAPWRPAKRRFPGRKSTSGSTPSG